MRPMGSIFLRVATMRDVWMEYRSPRRFFFVRSCSEPPPCAGTGAGASGPPPRGRGHRGWDPPRHGGGDSSVLHKDGDGSTGTPVPRGRLKAEEPVPPGWGHQGWGLRATGVGTSGPPPRARGPGGVRDRSPMSWGHRWWDSRATGVGTSASPIRMGTSVLGPPDRRDGDIRATAPVPHGSRGPKCGFGGQDPRMPLGVPAWWPHRTKPWQGPGGPRGGGPIEHNPGGVLGVPTWWPHRT